MEALLSRRQLRYVTLGMRSTDMLLHGAISLLLLSRVISSMLAKRRLGSRGRLRLTPRQRLRQLEPSWFSSGQTTSLLASVMENDEVSEDRGGILDTPPCEGRGFRGEALAIASDKIEIGIAGVN